MRKIILFVLITLFSFSVSASEKVSNPKEVKKYFGEKAPLGTGTLYFWGFKVYDAAFWSETKEDWDIDKKFILRLKYARDFTSESLVDTSIEEIARLKDRDEKTLSRYNEVLTKVFPSVKKGDTITAVNSPKNSAVIFYHNGKKIGEHTEKRFAYDFFSIWLDPETKAAELRGKLLGLE